jgi:DNA-binding PadR family transcriptional regulator
MAAVTRVLVLGVLLGQPMHGYEVRRKLESWNAEQWANIAYGSIYFSLSKMAEEHLVEIVSTDDRGNRPARTVYGITDEGRRDFERQLRELWWEYRPVIDPFRVALSFMNCLPPDEVLAALRHRATGLRSTMEAFPYAIEGRLRNPTEPRHLAEVLRLAAAHMKTQLCWIEDTIDKVERGEMP